MCIKSLDPIYMGPRPSATINIIKIGSDRSVRPETRPTTDPDTREKTLICKTAKNL
jgi:hypothetical protein